ncbi:DNA-3-methyladenine glycosylase 2 family protein [Streptomyces sp. JNUCC 64]
MTDEETRYEAVRGRDARFDGEFFFAVETTGIYCRPSCPARTPRRENVRFYPSAAAAQLAGYRACRRCRPDAVPGSAAWNVRADAVARAVRMIGDGVVDREGVTGLAARLGYSTRQVRRQLVAELGAGPVALARAQRTHTARTLLQTTALPVTEIAFASGFASVRQFNDTLRAGYGMTPTEVRAAAPRAARPAVTGRTRTPDVPLRLAHRGPYPAGPVFDLLAAAAVPGIEEVTGAPGRRTYRRTLRLPYGTALVTVAERVAPVRRAPGGQRPGGWLDARLRLTDPRDLTTAVQRLRGLFDLDADPYAVDERLGADPRLAPLVTARPGLRSPGSADPAEAAVRALVGPAGAERLVARFGTPLDTPCGTLTHLFPEPATLAAAVPDGPLGSLARALADGTLRLDAGADRAAAHEVLRTLPGLGARAVTEIRTRALGDPDVAPPGVRLPDSWRPWRSYALAHLRAARTGGDDPLPGLPAVPDLSAPSDLPVPLEASTTP